MPVSAGVANTFAIACVFQYVASGVLTYSAGAMALLFNALLLGRLRTITYAVPPGNAYDGFEWHGQELQDCMAHALLSRKRNGSFIDLAANHWQIFSNTLSLERDYLWTGLCIEPNPIYHEGLMHNRTCQVVAALVSASEGPAFFSAAGSQKRAASCDKLSMDISEKPHYCQGSEGKLVANGRAGGAAAWTVSFERILLSYQLPRNIDFMSLDVNGPEEAVMRAFPFHRHNITVMTIEGPSPGLKQHLSSHDYLYLCTVGRLDEMWVHQPSFSIDGARWAQTFLSITSSQHRSSCASLVFQHSKCQSAQAQLGKKYRTTGVLPRQKPKDVKD